MLSSLMIGLKKEEKDLLWRKYVNSGLSYEEANFKLNKTIKYLNDLIKKLREQKKSPSYIQERFAMEFEKLTE